MIQGEEFVLRFLWMEVDHFQSVVVKCSVEKNQRWYAGEVRHGVNFHVVVGTVGFESDDAPGCLDSSLGCIKFVSFDSIWFRATIFDVLKYDEDHEVTVIPRFVLADILGLSSVGFTDFRVVTSDEVPNISTVPLLFADNTD